jgi:pimeloyl-ACP methyl ester carboxylesterase
MPAPEIQSRDRTEPVPEPVILVHGLWMGGWALTPLRLNLQRHGFEGHAFSYATMRQPLAENARCLAAFARSIGAPTLHFIGHSLGGLIVYRALLDHADLPPGRVVLLGSPFLDSYAARRFGVNPFGHTLLGASMWDWLESGAPPGGAPRELGVVAGSLGIGLGSLVAPQLPRPHDGVVAVSETRVPGAADHIVLPVTHSAMLVAASVARQACHFLRCGRFRHEDDAARAA